MISLSLLVSLLLIAAPAPQNLKTPKKTEVFRPAVVDEAVFTEKMSLSLKDQKYGQSGTGRGFQKKYWDAYSDREDNVTYATNRTKEPYGKLSYLQKVRIAQIRTDAALVYAVPDEETVYPALPKDVKWLGWIPMDRLILWDRAPVSEEGLDIKVLLNWKAPDADALFSVSPVKDMPVPQREQSYYYLVKTGKDRMLLSRKPEIGTNASNLCGWVADSSVILWKSRMAVEPEWEPEVVEEFSGFGVGSLLWDPEVKSDVVLEGICGKLAFRSPNPSKYDESFYRLPQNSWRYPLSTEIDTELENGWIFYLPADSPFLSKESRVPSSTGKRQSFRAVRAEKSDPTGRPFFHRVALFTEDELDDLLSSLAPVHSVNLKHSYDRERLYDAFVSMVNSNPSSVTKPEKCGIYKALRIAEGLQGLSDAYPGPAISEFKETDKMTPERIDRILSDISVRYRNLLTIRMTDYPFTSMMNGIKHYWIPLELLP